MIGSSGGRRFPSVALVLVLAAALAGCPAADTLSSNSSGGLAVPLLSPFGAPSPFDVGLSWPGVGEFRFEVSTPSLRGLALVPNLEGLNLASTGGWANFSLPGPLTAKFSSALSLASAAGVARDLASDVQITAKGVQVALQVGKSMAAGGVNDGCLVVARAVVQVGSAVRSAQCDGSGCPSPAASNSSDGSEQEVDPAGVGFAIAQALRGSPEVLQLLNPEGCDLDLSLRDLLAEQLPEGIPAEPRSFLLVGIVLLVMLAAGVVLGVTFCGCCMGCCCWRNAEESEEEAAFLDRCRSLVQTDTLPLWSKAAFFIAVVANVAFFVSANVSVGAEINIDYTFEGEFVDLPSIYDFSMLNSTIEMLKAGVYLLGLILLGFSVFWPYIKLAILSAMFALPCSWLRPLRRASIMEWIDTLGKWSMFDVFALCACMVIFLVEVQSPATALHPLGYYGFILSMTPVWGMYANLIAQIMSQCLSVFALWAHHLAYRADWQTLRGPKEGSAAKSPPPAAGSNHKAPVMPAGAVMGQELPGVEGSLRPTRLAQLLVAGMLVTVIAFVVGGFFVTGFTVRVVGLLGLVQELATPGSSTRYFTPLYVAQQMTTVIPAGQPGIAIGTYALIVMLVACVLLVPLAQAAVLLAIWALPLPLPRLRSLLKANELLASWQYIEVYLIAVVVGCLQIPVVCSLLVGDSCDPIQPGLDLLVEAGVMSHATCFSMAPKVRPGLWLLFLGSLLLYAASVVVREAANSLVDAYDPLRAAQARQLTRQQVAYYGRRTRCLALLRLVDCDGPALAPATSDSSASLPVAGAAI